MRIKTSTLVFIDGLFAPINRLFSSLSNMGVKRRNETKNLLVIKFFGMGSIVRMAYVLKNSDVDLTNITLITLKKK